MYPVTTYESNPFFGGVYSPQTEKTVEPQLPKESVEFDYSSSPFTSSPVKETPKNPWIETTKSVVNFIASIFKIVQEKISAYTSKVKEQKTMNDYVMPQMDFCPIELDDNLKFLTSFFDMEAQVKAKTKILNFYSFIVR